MTFTHTCMYTRQGFEICMCFRMMSPWSDQLIPSPHQRMPGQMSLCGHSLSNSSTQGASTSLIMVMSQKTSALYLRDAPPKISLIIHHHKIQQNTKLYHDLASCYNEFVMHPNKAGNKLHRSIFRYG